MIEDQGKVRMTLTPSDHQFVPINIADICKAITTCVSKLECDDDHKIATLTGPEAISPQELVVKLNSAVQAKYSYEEISRDELRKYLESFIEGESEDTIKQVHCNKEESEVNKHDSFKPRKDQIT